MIEAKKRPTVRQRKKWQTTLRERLEVCYTKYFLELILRQKPLPPSKDGRHIPLRPSHDKSLIDERTGSAYVSNSIRSSRYTIWDFLPKQFFFQATRLNNVYFIAIGIPQAIPGISTTGNYTTILPLLFFICLTVAKEGYDDYRRHRMDKVENNHFASVLQAKERRTTVTGWIESLKGGVSKRLFELPGLSRYGKRDGNHIAPEQEEEETELDETYEWTKVRWHNIKVGDIVRLKRNDAVPADIALLHASNENGVVYIETTALDGETNLKIKQAPHDFQGCGSIKGVKATHAEFVVEDPNRNLYDFNGRVTLDGSEKTIPLTLNEVVYRGSVLRNTSLATGMVINTGEQCKIRMNANHHPKAKKPRLEWKSNQIVLTLIVYVVLLSVGLAVGYSIWHRHFETHAWYLSGPSYNAYVSFRDIIIGFLIMFNNVIPLAMYISLEIVKVGQMLMIQGDKEMFDQDSNTAMTCNTNTILENLGQVTHVFSDKTGTLTENVMKFRKMSIAGIPFAHDPVCETKYKADCKSPEAGCQNISVDSVAEERQGHRGTGGNESVSSTTTILERRGIITTASGIHIHEPPQENRAPLDASPFEDTGQHKLMSSQLMEHLHLHPDSAFSRTARDFVLGLALCHTALPGIGTNGQVDFEAPSPDEVALVHAAHELGYTLTSRSSQAITLRHVDSAGHQTEHCYEILDVINFSSKRKRMSIILRCPDGRIWMLCKGADTVIMGLLQQASLATRKSQDIRRSRQLERQAQRQSAQLEVRNSLSARVSLALSGRSSMDIQARPKSEIYDTKGNISVPMRSLDIPKLSPDLDMLNDAEVTDESLIFRRCFQHMDEFATEGLRTLLFAQKTISASEYADWKQKYQDATTSLTDRQEKIEAAGELIEHGFDLLGASAIEDKLQKGVPETIEKLGRANMKIWMLTGDKRETASTLR